MSSNQKSRDTTLEALAAVPDRAAANDDKGNKAPSGGAGNENGEGAESGESNAAELQSDEGAAKGGDGGTNDPELQAAEGAQAVAAPRTSPARENVLDNAAGAAVGNPGELAPKLGGGGSNVENLQEDLLAPGKHASAVGAHGGNPEKLAAEKGNELFGDSSSDEGEEGGDAPLGEAVNAQGEHGTCLFLLINLCFAHSNVNFSSPSFLSPS